MPASDHSRVHSDTHRPVANYDELFKRPLLSPDPPDNALRHESDFFRRNRNAIWWSIIFFALAATVTAMIVSSNETIVAEDGCGDSGWPGLFSWLTR